MNSLARPMGFPAKATMLLDDIRHAINHNPDVAQRAAQRLVMFLTPTVPGEPDDVRGGLAPWQKRKIERYLADNLLGSLPLEELARQMLLSVSHFSRAFKESFGTTPHTHIVRLRLALAQRLMLTTEEPLSQIAIACGLSDQAQLCKIFRRCAGETPSAWRRRSLTDVPVAVRPNAVAAKSFDNLRQPPSGGFSGSVVAAE